MHMVVQLFRGCGCINYVSCRIEVRSLCRCFYSQARHSDLCFAICERARSVLKGKLSDDELKLFEEGDSLDRLAAGRYSHELAFECATGGLLLEARRGRPALVGMLLNAYVAESGLLPGKTWLEQGSERPDFDFGANPSYNRRFRLWPLGISRWDDLLAESHAFGLSRDSRNRTHRSIDSALFRFESGSNETTSSSAIPQLVILVLNVLFASGAVAIELEDLFRLVLPPDVVGMSWLRLIQSRAPA